jgi:hypothetical protein
MSVDYRMDGRTREVGSHNIKDFTRRELIVGKILTVQYRKNGRPCSVKNTGTDNTGEFIEGNLKEDGLDFLFEFEDGDKIPTDIKNCPKIRSLYYTFKTNTLKKAAALNGQIIAYARNYYFTVTAEGCRFLLENFPASTSYKNFSGHPCIRVYSRYNNKIREVPERLRGPAKWEDLVEKGLVKDEEWSPKAQKFINEMSSVLFAPKKI